MRNGLRVALALVLASLAIRDARAADDAGLQKRLEQLESENKKLKSDYAKIEGEVNGAFSDATAAENAAGLRVTTCAAVSPPGVPDSWPVAGVVHIRLLVRHGDFDMVPSAFAPARMVANQRVQQATMTFTRKAR